MELGLIYPVGRCRGLGRIPEPLHLAEDDVRAEVWEQQRSPGAGRGACIGDSGQFLELDGDGLRPVLGGVAVLRHHEGDRLPEVADPIPGEGRLRGLSESLDGYRVHQRSVIGERRRREHGSNTVQTDRSLWIDPTHDGMRERGSHEGCVESPRDANIGQVLARSGEKPRILPPDKRRADQGGHPVPMANHHGVPGRQPTMPRGGGPCIRSTWNACDRWRIRTGRGKIDCGHTI